MLGCGLLAAPIAIIPEENRANWSRAAAKPDVALKGAIPEPHERPPRPVA